MAASEQTLEALVRDELRGPVSELVRQVVVELVHEQLNGASPSAEVAQVSRRRPGPSPKAAPAERTCNRCGQVKPSGEYAPGRGTCRSCRRAQQREHDRRAALADDEEPHPVGAQHGRKSRRLLDSERAWRERRRRLIQEAPVTRELRDGREYVVLHLAPQSSLPVLPP